MQRPSELLKVISRIVELFDLTHFRRTDLAPICCMRFGCVVHRYAWIEAWIDAYAQAVYLHQCDDVVSFSSVMCHNNPPVKDDSPS